MEMHEEPRNGQGSATHPIAPPNTPLSSHSNILSGDMDTSMTDSNNHLSTPALSLGRQQNALKMQLATIGLLAQPEEVQKHIMKVLSGEINMDVSHLLVGGVTDERSAESLMKVLPFRTDTYGRNKSKKEYERKKRVKKARSANLLAEGIVQLDLGQSTDQRTAGLVPE